MANYTKTLIIETFENMVERMPFDKITVTALIKECNIGRNTFYYHYEDIYALLDDILIKILKKYDDSVKETDWKDVFKSLLKSCKENKNKVYNIFNSISRERLERYIFDGMDSIITSSVMEIAKSRNISNERAEIVANIVRYSLYGYFIHFLLDNMDYDIDNGTDSLFNIYDEMIDQMLR